MLLWLGFDRAHPNRWFSRASLVESMHWMVLHRPVELVRLIGSYQILCLVCIEFLAAHSPSLRRQEAKNTSRPPPHQRRRQARTQRSRTRPGFEAQKITTAE